MVKILIVTHGELARVLLAAAETIAGGKSRALSALSLDWEDDQASAREKVRQAIEEVAPDDGLLILTDMYGGTPHNVAASFSRRGQVEVVAGVNLPMVLRLECRTDPEMGVTELARWIEAKGRSSIRRGRGEGTGSKEVVLAASCRDAVDG